MEIFGQDYPTRDGTCVRDYIQVTDLIDAHLAALAYLRGGGAGLICNCGYGHGQTVKEVVEVVKRVSGVDFRVVMSPRRPGDPAALVARADRAKARSRWRPARDNLDEIVRQALDWKRAYPQPPGPQALTALRSRRRPFRIASPRFLGFTILRSHSSDLAAN